MSTNSVAEQIKSSAATAGLFSLIVFLLGVARFTLLDWVFNTKSMSWRMSLELVGAISGLAFAAMFASTFLGLRTSDYRQETDVRSFRATVLSRIFWASAGPSVLLFWWLGGFGGQHDPILMLMLSLSLGLLALFRWPRTITLNEVGISQHSLFGIRRAIPYSEVEYISYEPKRQTTFVVGPGLTTITHTVNHSDRELFHSLLKERTKKEVQNSWR
jgi:hypothetical protein